MIFSEFIKGIFAPGALAGFAVGQIIALPPKFASLAVDNTKSFISVKEGFFCGDMYRKRG